MNMIRSRSVINSSPVITSGYTQLLSSVPEQCRALSLSLSLSLISAPVQFTVCNARFLSSR